MEAHNIPRQSPDMLPAKCLNNDCRFEFYGHNPIFVGGGSRNITVQDCKIPCPKCGSWAQQVDWKIDSQGNFQITSLLADIRNINDFEKLRQLNSNLEAANDENIATELTNALEEIDPSFSRYREYLKSIPSGLMLKLIELLVSLIFLYIANATLDAQNESKELSEEANEIQRESLELEREKFKYQKQQDALKVKELEEKIENLIEPDKSETTKLPNKCAIKGSLRNKPCPCGSGKKAKKCHPYGLQSA